MSERRSSIGSASNASAATDAVSAEEMSVRGPALLLLWAGAKWLVLSTVLGLLVSLKFHGPALLSDYAWTSYGRLQPAFWNALLYGFGLSTAWGSSMWMLARCGRTRLAFPSLAIGGGVLWNVGLLIGLIGILKGDSTGHPLLELPGYATPIMLAGCALVSVSLLSTIRTRQTGAMVPEQWFVMAAVLWFAWCYSTAQFLLTAAPVRGIMQSIVAWWFGAQLMWVVLSFFVFALLWHLLGHLLASDRLERGLVLVFFWMSIAFAGWRGIPLDAPVPAWMPSVSTVFSVLSLVPFIALVMFLKRTVSGGIGRLLSSGVGIATLVGGLFYVAALALGIFQSWPSFGGRVAFTFFGPGLQALMIYGAVGSVLLGAARMILSRIFGDGVQSIAASLTPVLLWLAGVAIHAIPLMVGGWAQGGAMADPQLTFMEAFKSGLMALRVSTLGDLLLVAAAVVFFFQFLKGWMAACRSCCLPVAREALATESVEVAQ
jgi:cytochrome c oxidase cbb3-type subunit 1